MYPTNTQYNEIHKNNSTKIDKDKKKCSVWKTSFCFTVLLLVSHTRSVSLLLVQSLFLLFFPQIFSLFNFFLWDVKRDAYTTQFNDTLVKTEYRRIFYMFVSCAFIVRRQLDSVVVVMVLVVIDSNSSSRSSSSTYVRTCGRCLLLMMMMLSLCSYCYVVSALWTLCIQCVCVCFCRHKHTHTQTNEQNGYTCISSILLGVWSCLIVCEHMCVSVV